MFMSVPSKGEIEKDFKIRQRKPSEISMQSQTLNLELFGKVENQMVSMLEKEV